MKNQPKNKLLKSYLRNKTNKKNGKVKVKIKIKVESLICIEMCFFTRCY